MDDPRLAIIDLLSMILKPLGFRMDNVRESNVDWGHIKQVDFHATGFLITICVQKQGKIKVYSGANKLICAGPVILDLNDPKCDVDWVVRAIMERYLRILKRNVLVDFGDMLSIPKLIKVLSGTSDRLDKKLNVLQKVCELAYDREKSQFKKRSKK
jgi:hypothetical protein